MRHRRFAHHHAAHNHPIDDHPAAAFGIMIGTLAVLTAVLVFSMYVRADDAGRRIFLGPVHSTTHQR